MRFAIGGDLRFVAHRDLVRFFERALVRARVPVRYSSGFNPRLRLWIPLPRPVGVSGEDELLIIELNEAVEPGKVLEALRAQMPSDVSLREAAAVATRATPRPVGAEYRLPVTNGLRSRLVNAAAGFLSRTVVDAHRDDPGDVESKTINIRPFIEALEVDADELKLRVYLTPSGSVRPRELLAALGLAPDDHQHRLRRTAVTWEWPSTASLPRAAADEGATH